MPRVSIVLVAGALAVEAGRRMREAAARSAAADALLTFDESRQALNVEPSSDPEPELPPTLPRAAGAWLLSWPLDGLSRIKLAIARSISASRARARARERPAARARDGPD